jgi:hypothetical protein
MLTQFRRLDTVCGERMAQLVTAEHWRILRLDDTIFTILREPVQRVVSHVNYIVGRILSIDQPVKPDTKQWRGVVGIEDKDERAITISSKSLVTSIREEPPSTCRCLPASTRPPVNL